MSKFLPYLLGHGSHINKATISSQNLYSYYPAYVFKSTKFDHKKLQHKAFFILFVLFKLNLNSRKKDLREIVACYYTGRENSTKNTPHFSNKKYINCFLSVILKPE